MDNWTTDIEILSRRRGKRPQVILRNLENRLLRSQDHMGGIIPRPQEATSAQRKKAVTATRIHKKEGDSRASRTAPRGGWHTIGRLARGDNPLKPKVHDVQGNPRGPPVQVAKFCWNRVRSSA